MMQVAGSSMVVMAVPYLANNRSSLRKVIQEPQKNESQHRVHISNVHHAITGSTPPAGLQRYERFHQAEAV